MKQAKDTVGLIALVPSYWWASLVAQTVKNLPAMWETWVWSLGQEDPLEKGMATHLAIPAWTIPCTEQPGGLQSMGSWRVRCDWVTNTFTFLQAVGRTDSTPRRPEATASPSDLLLSRVVIPKKWATVPNTCSGTVAQKFCPGRKAAITTESS